MRGKLFALLLAPFWAHYLCTSFAVANDDLWTQIEETYLIYNGERGAKPKNRFHSYKQAVVHERPDNLAFNKARILERLNTSEFSDWETIEAAFVVDEVISTEWGDFVFFRIAPITNSSCEGELTPKLSGFFLLSGDRILLDDSRIECVDIDLGGENKKLWDVYYRGSELIALLFKQRYESYFLSEYVVDERGIHLESELEVGGL